MPSRLAKPPALVPQATASIIAVPMGLAFRSSMLSQRGSDYILAAQTLGLSRRTITMSHVLPNSVGPVIVQATLVLATAIIEVAETTTVVRRTLRGREIARFDSSSEASLGQ